MNRLFFLLIVFVISQNAYTSSESFEPTYLHGKKLHDFVKERFKSAMSWDKDFDQTTKVEIETKTIPNSKYLLSRFYASGEGYPTKSSELLQFISLYQEGSDILLFHSGEFMPECGSDDWKFDDIQTEFEDGILTIWIDKYVNGCHGVRASITNYNVRYNISAKTLIKYTFKGESL